MGLSLDGLASGLDSTTLINSLMQVEAIPQNLLKNKVNASQTMVSALQALNTKVAELAALSTKLAEPAAIQRFTATSSSDAVTLEASQSAAAGSLEITVTQLAQNQVLVTDPITQWDSNQFNITVAGQPYSITADSASIDDVVTAVNASEAGIQATKFDAGNGEYRIQFSAAGTGAANSFQIGGTSVPLTQIQAAQDAEVLLWAGTAAEQKITSASNTFTGLLPGVDVDVAKVSADPVKLTVTQDAEATAKEVSSLVDSLNGLFTFIAGNSAVSIGTGGATKAMIFTGDSTVRSIKQRIMDAAYLPVDGMSPSEAGISITKDGKLEFDTEKFSKMLAADPAKAQQLVATIASRVSAASRDLSDKYDGAITARIKGQESAINRLNDQILDWDQRLDQREASLKRIYAALEVQMSNMNAQQSYLASQLASLPTTKDK